MAEQKRDLEKAGLSEVAERGEKTAGSDSQLSRRKALLLGLSAVPAIITLTNRSAFGQAQVTCSMVGSWANNGKVIGSVVSLQQISQGELQAKEQECLGAPVGDPQPNATSNRRRQRRQND